MSKTKIALSAMTILMLPLLAAAAHKPAAPAAPAGSIGGTVLSNGAQVADATVTVWRDTKQVGSVAVTGGHFTYSGPEGTYEVQPAAPHFKPAVAARITVVVHAGRETWVNLVMVAAQ